MQLHLVDVSPEIVEAWKTAFNGLDDVVIACGNILELAEDTIVSPANSYGYMDGGIDRIYRDFFGLEIETKVQDSIRQKGWSYLPVGSSIVVKTNHKRIRFTIVAPTMFLPEPIQPKNCFYAMFAVLKACDRHSHIIRKVFCPGLGTGVGCVDPIDSANEMAKAYTKWLNSKIG